VQNARQSGQESETPPRGPGDAFIRHTLTRSSTLRASSTHFAVASDPDWQAALSADSNRVMLGSCDLGHRLQRLLGLRSGRAVRLVRSRFDLRLHGRDLQLPHMTPSPAALIGAWPVLSAADRQQREHKHQRACSESAALLLHG
jgi:hypothetical protein